MESPGGGYTHTPSPRKKRPPASRPHQKVLSRPAAAFWVCGRHGIAQPFGDGFRAPTKLGGSRVFFFNKGTMI